MVVEVATYYHPKKWREHPSYETIKDEIHICATRNMADGIEERYRNDELEEFQHIFTMQQVMDRVLTQWGNPERLLQQYLSLSKTIHDLPGKANLKSAFRSNTSELLDTIRFLVFCGIEPSSMPNEQNLTEKEQFFLELWKAIEKDDDKVYTFMKGFSKSKWGKEKIIKRLNWIHESKHKQKPEEELLNISDDKKKIILHGFYFITPEQQVFLKFLERSGFELIFFQYYDNRFPNTFDFIKNFISESNGWTDNWQVQTQEEQVKTIGTQFLKTFEDGVQKNIKKEKNVLAYDSFFDFLHQVIIPSHPIGEEEKIEDARIIATNADILNEMLVQYYPDQFVEERNFLNYPVGQFIMNIHKMREGNKLYLDNEIIMTSFSSGWLTDKKTNKNAQNYTYELEQLLPFFTDCTEVSQWIERMDYLLTIYDEILPLFEDESDNRVLESVRSPFAKIAHFSLSKEKIVQLKGFFELLKNIAEDLFDLGNEETSLDKHFIRLSKLMQENSPITNKVLLQKEEENLIEILYRKIEEIDDTHAFLYDDIGEAIQFYLSGSFSNEEKTFVTPFIEVDGEAFKNNDEKVYLTGLDEQGLPLGEFDIPWPLQESTFELLSENHKVLKLNKSRNDSVKKISRYLLFIALEFLSDEQLELSWIKNFLDREGLEPAVYVRYMNMNISNKSIIEEDIQDDKNIEEYNTFDFTALKPEDSLLEKAVEELKYEDILAEYVMCPRRFYYGFILERYPTFSDEFIHQFLYSEITNVIKRATKADNKKVIEVVSEIFPQWTTYQKENMASTALIYTGGNDVKSEVNGAKVSEARKNFQFPGLGKAKDKHYLDVAKKKESILEDIIQSSGEASSNMMTANPDHHCRFCPFLDDCKEGQYALD